MTPSIILTRVTATATWHDDNLTRGNFLIFFKNSKKKSKFKKKFKKKKLIKNSKNRGTDT